MQLQGKYPVVRAKTADFTLDPTTTRVGTLFTNAGAGGAVTCTLPQLNAQGGYDGFWVEFIGIADQTFGFAAAAGKAITFNNAAATSLKAQTGGQKIGARLKAIWIGSQLKWHLEGDTVGVTYTVA